LQEETHKISCTTNPFLNFNNKKRKEKQLLSQEIFSYHFSLFYEMHHHKKCTNFEFHTLSILISTCFVRSFPKFFRKSFSRMVS
jgi:folylpolyglutamate synthase/dihydropteroate synthase